MDKPMHNYGDYIELIDCYSDIVRGHVTLDEFNNALTQYAINGYSVIVHRYARWIHCFKNQGMDYSMYLDYPCERKRGAFPVTVGIR
jgi:hypothetical protein